MLDVSELDVSVSRVNGRSWSYRKFVYEIVGINSESLAATHRSTSVKSVSHRESLRIPFLFCYEETKRKIGYLPLFGYSGRQ